MKNSSLFHKQALNSVSKNESKDFSQMYLVKPGESYLVRPPSKILPFNQAIKNSDRLYQKFGSQSLNRLTLKSSKSDVNTSSKNPKRYVKIQES